MGHLNSGIEGWQKRFDARAYLNTFYRTDMFDRQGRFLADFMTQIADKMHQIMSTGTCSGQKMLDFGCGPVIHYSISPSRQFDEIYFADFKSNLSEIQKWINRSPDAFDWSHFFQQYAEREGVSPSEAEERMRSKVKGTIPYTTSLLDAPPLDDDWEEEFDLVMAFNCLIVICDSMQDYTRCLKNLGRYVKPGGHLLVSETLKETRSVIGSQKFKMFPLEYDDVTTCFSEAGFITIETQLLSYSDTNSNFCDSNSFHFGLLQKQKIN